MMGDDLEALAGDARLCRLLQFYREAGGDDREAWHDRAMAWEDGTAQEVARWHGALLAANWLEQNTGYVSGAAAGRVPACYRVTREGRAALKKANVG